MAQSSGRGQPDHRADRDRGRAGRADLVRRRQPGRADADRRHRRLRERAARVPARWGHRPRPSTRSRTCPPASVPGIAAGRGADPRTTQGRAGGQRDGAKLADLPAGALIGTGSPRRAAQLRLLRRTCARSRCAATPAPGWRKVTSGELDARRAGPRGPGPGSASSMRSREIFEPDEMIPAAGQGALAVECRDGRPGAGHAAGPRGRPDEPCGRHRGTRGAGRRCRSFAATRRSAPTPLPPDMLHLRAVVVGG